MEMLWHCDKDVLLMHFFGLMCKPVRKKLFQNTSLGAQRFSALDLCPLILVFCFTFFNNIFPLKTEARIVLKSQNCTWFLHNSSKYKYVFS